ncbi:MAG: hypothetical protein DGJ47_000203 [Rickettsiaceae bacterium]
MKILFIHPNFPGQFKHLAKEFAKYATNEVVFACRFPNRSNITNVRKVVAKPIDASKRNLRGHRYLNRFNTEVYMGQSMWRALHQLKKEGFVPDVIYAHSGWGDSLFVKDVFPDSSYIAYMEFYYHAFGADKYFFPTDKINVNEVAHTRIKNSNHLLNLAACDWAISPTRWQASLHPKDFHYKFSVIHEGIDTSLLKPSKRKEDLVMPDGRIIGHGEELITYITRNCEPYRGFEQAMQAISLLHKSRPNAKFVIVGDDRVGYGAATPGEKTYKDMVLEKINLNFSNILFYDKLKYSDYIKLLQKSTVHIYLTVPFVLSWSMLESMSAGCAVVASDTKPVIEVIEDGKNGMLADFFAPKEIAEKVEYLLNNPQLRQKISQNARETIKSKYSLKKIMPQYISLIKSVAKKLTNSKIQKKLII